MTLLEAILALSKEAEARRLEMRELYAAVGKLAEEMGAELRDGDQVDVDGRLVSAVSFQVEGLRGGATRRMKTLAIDGRTFGDKSIVPAPVASLADHRWFAEHAKDVFAALTKQLARDKRRLRADRKLVEESSDGPR